jgi:hypothetical protein
MKASEFLEVILMAQDCPKEIKPLIEEYGKMRVIEHVQFERVFLALENPCICEPPITRDSEDSSMCSRCGNDITD